MLVTLLINFLFILTPFLLYFVFFETRKIVHIRLVFAILAAITMILCMSYPIHLQSGFIVDLRYIPFIVVALYWGFKNVLILYFILNIYRIIIGGDGLIQSFIYSTLILMAVPWCHRKFTSMSVKHRIIFGSIIALLNVLLYLIALSFQIPLNREFWALTINSTLTYFVMMVVTISLIERILTNIRTRELVSQSERFHVISELSASVAHEIRNPLTTTHGFLQLLNESDSITMKEKSYIDYSLQELHRAEKIISDFLTFSKPQDENMVDSNLKEEIEYAKNILMPYANMHHVQLKISFHNSLHRKFDRSQIQQCFINLYKNGIEAMKENGGVLLIEVSEKDRNIIIKIQDSGVGMNEVEMASLGKPYYSTKKQGTGLGMVMIYNAIHKVGGTIKVESKKEKGTTFIIVMPV